VSGNVTFPLQVSTNEKVKAGLFSANSHGRLFARIKVVENPKKREKLTVVEIDFSI